jgi:hypothetical protein
MMKNRYVKRSNAVRVETESDPVTVRAVTTPLAHGVPTLGEV